MNISPLTVSDSIDGSNSAAGVMAAMQNLVPALHTQRVWVPRPASEQFAAFAGFTTPAQIECLLVLGSRCYGLIASSRFAGRSEPFCYDRLTGAYITIQGATAQNCPITQPTQGDWTPPTMALFGGRIMVTHPGFGAPAIPVSPPIPIPVFGWFDLTGFLDATGKTGTVTLASNVITHLSANPLQAGWRPGQLLQDAQGLFPVGARIVSVDGNALTVTLDNPAVGSGVLDTLTVAGGSRLSLLWGAGNLNGLPLVGPPVAVAQFSGCAFYAIANALVFSDPGDPLSATNAFGIQVLTFQDGGNVTAMAGLPLNSLQGGIVQAIMAFQGAEQIQQITGSFPTSPVIAGFTVNKLNVATGTLAQNTIAITSRGMAFIAPDGLRIIDFTARTSDPIGAYGGGVSLPFRYAVNPSRMAAAFNGDVYRVSLTTPISGGAVQTQSLQSEEFWYHLTTGQWSGPHTFPAGIIAADELSLGFVLAGLGINAKLWQSDTLPGPNSTYTENGQALSWVALTSMLPDNQVMSENSMVETAITIAIKPNDSITVQFNNQAGQILDSVAVAAVFFQAAVWGGFNWGAALWGDVLSRFMQYRISWHQPLVFKQGQLLLTGLSAPGVAIGNLHLKTEHLGYLLMEDTARPVVPIVPPSQSEMLLNQGGVALLNQGGDALLNQ